MSRSRSGRDDPQGTALGGEPAETSRLCGPGQQSYLLDICHSRRLTTKQPRNPRRARVAGCKPLFVGLSPVAQSPAAKWDRCISGRVGIPPSGSTREAPPPRGSPYEWKPTQVRPSPEAHRICVDCIQSRRQPLQNRYSTRYRMQNLRKDSVWMTGPRTNSTRRVAASRVDWLSNGGLPPNADTLSKAVQIWS